MTGNFGATPRKKALPCPEDQRGCRERFFNKYGCVALSIAIASVITAMCGTLTALLSHPDAPMTLTAWVIWLLRFLGVSA